MFPPVDRKDVGKIDVPVLVLSGENTRGIAKYTDDELESSLPHDSRRRVVIRDTTHMMWLERPVESRDAVLRFIREMGSER